MSGTVSSPSAGYFETLYQEAPFGYLVTDRDDVVTRVNTTLLDWVGVEAQRLIGVKEDVSARSNPLLIGWGRDLDLRYTDDETPWCGLFIAHCIAATLPHESLPADPLGAQKWRKFGTFVTPQLGAIMVFWREKETSWKGHVGLYAGEDETAFHILGGNQSDSVSIARIERRRFLEARWPASIPIGVGSAMIVQEGAGLSTNEA